MDRVTRNREPMLFPDVLSALRSRSAAWALAALASLSAGCGGGTPPATSSAPTAAPKGTETVTVDADQPLPPPAYETALPEAVRAVLGNRFTGDLDGMVARRVVRIGVTFNRTFY